MVKISVIMPVYNAESYLEESLDSVINQTFRDFELICIDDGSTDDSLKILESYKQKDGRIEIISQENHGIGASRNRGLDFSSGEYVYFIDSDDYLELTAFEQLMDLFSKHSVDFIMFKIRNFDEDTGKDLTDDYYTMPDLKKRVGKSIFNYECVREIALDLCVCPPGNIFKRKLIEEVKFPEGLLFEDNVFFTHCLFKANSIYFHDKFLYNRRKHSNSITSPITTKSLDTIEITNQMLDLCQKYGYHHEKELYYRIFHNMYQIFKRADETQKEEMFEKIKKDYLKNRDKWESDEYFQNKLKAKYKRIFNCAIKSQSAGQFESCVENRPKESVFKKLRKKLL